MIANLLKASDDFHAAMAHLLDAAPPIRDEQPRFVVSAISAMLAVEHGTATRLCFVAGFPSSATAILRLRYEATVRSAWLLHVATDEQINLIDRPLDSQGEDPGRKLPGATAMLKVLSSRAPEGLVVPLRQFYDVTWQGLNSFIHAGIHPLRRQSDGFPEELACQLLRSANAILHVSYRMLAALTGSAAAMSAMTDLWKDHRSCLPIDPRAGA
jgi:hypothetical protein